MENNGKVNTYCLKCGFRITSTDEVCARCGSTTIIKSHGLQFKLLKTNELVSSFFCECGRSIKEGSKISDYSTIGSRAEIYLTCKCDRMSKICSDDIDYEELDKIMSETEFYVCDVNGKGIYVKPLKRQYEAGFNKLYNDYQRIYNGLEQTLTKSPEDRIDNFESRPYVFCLLHEETVIGFVETMDITNADYDEIMTHKGWEDPMSTYIEAIYVDPKYRGLGLGGVLVDFSSSPTYTFLTAENENLVKYYERLGFELLGEKVLVRT